MILLLHALVALAAIIATTRVVGYLFKRLNQPAVIGELAAGILLGPSFFGWMAPGVYAELLSPDVLPLLRAFAQVGVVLFMFLVGLELDLGVIRQNTRATLSISQASIVFPFVLGLAFAPTLHARLSSASVPSVPFALFLGISMSVTAFPVLARILGDRGMTRTRLGTIAMACAAVNDLAAWCLLAVVVALTTFGDLGSALAHLPAIVADHIGHYAIFGAFLLGGIIAASSRIAPRIDRRLQRIVSTLFLPVFFAVSGIRTEIGLIAGTANWALCAAIVAVACVGKIGGTAAAARVLGFEWRDSAVLGVLMNTRGLVELIVLNIGLDLGILSPTLFTMLVVMALVTTFMTSPLLGVLLPEGPQQS